MLKTLWFFQSLLKSPRFLPIFVAQFCGALNDNLYKSAMLILVAFQLTNAASDASTINNLAALLFILPFFLLSPIAGQLADRSNKSKMIQNNKIAEIIIAIAATASLFSQSIEGMLIVLFFLGAQSAMFGPNKYAVLPQLMNGKELVTANAMIASGTFIAILVGTLLGGILAQQSSSWLWIGSSCILVALMGYIAARRIPETDIGSPELQLNWNLYQQTRLLLALARQNQRTWAAILGVSWFWFTGVAYLTQIPAIVRYLAVGDETVVTLFLALFIVGVGLGCLFSAWLSGEKAETGISPIVLGLMGLVGLNLALIDTGALVPEHIGAGLSTARDFIGSPLGLEKLPLILLIGFFGGAFALPLYTELQQSTRTGNRARIISINNLLNALFMLASSIIALISLGLWQMSLSFYLGLVACLNIIFAFYLHSKLSVRTWRLLAQISSRLIYRLDTKQINKLPSEGSALLVCNHVAYTDPVIIMGACKRPIRFLMDKRIRETKGLLPIFRQTRTLGICSPLENRQAYEDTMAQAVQSLKNGELVFIFPEGQLTKDGDFGHFHRGLEKLVQGHPSPVIPMALQGLWGSFFSNENGFAFESGFRPRLSRRKVRLVVGDAVAPEQANAKRLKSEVEALRGDKK